MLWVSVQIVVQVLALCGERDMTTLLTVKAPDSADALSVTAPVIGPGSTMTTPGCWLSSWRPVTVADATLLPALSLTVVRRS